MRNETLFGSEDDLVMNEEVGSWSEEKYAQFRNYAQIFTRGMSKRWDSLTYLDLYSGSGLSRVKGTNQILLGSPLIALSIDVPFNRYVFCEKDASKLDALRARVTRDFPNANVQFVLGDCDNPSFQLGNYIAPRALTFCFVDPYSIDIRSLLSD
jgi:three-Cys-motif partner protein